jgi:hypothetical protein
MRKSEGLGYLSNSLIATFLNLEKLEIENVLRILSTSKEY